MPTSPWKYAGRTNLPATLLIIWWLPFTAISVYWGSGGLWLVDTTVQDYGVRLAHERPAWIVTVAFASALMKLGFVAWAYLIVAPMGRRVPRWLYLLFGCGAGTGSLLYGLVFTLTSLRHMWGQPITTRGWWHLLVWWPQFWVAGILTLTATIVFSRTTGRRTR